MKKTAGICTLIAALIFTATITQAADTDCTAKAGTWEVTYEGGKKTTWTLTEVDASVYVFDCQLDGSATGAAYTGAFQIVLLNIDDNFHYTETIPITQECETSILLFSEDGKSFTASAGSSIAIKSGKLITGGGDNETCPAQAALDNNAAKLEKLRQFRDSVLAKSFMGQKMIDLYYGQSSRLTALIEENPSLKTAAKNFIEKMIPIIERFTDK